jgi:hypothetical protein
VDAEIATLIRDYHRHVTRPGWKERCDWDSFSVGQKNDLERLCREPTAPGAEPFHHRVAEALGLMDGDSGRYIYADEAECLQEIRKNRRAAENWQEQRAVTDSGPSSADAEEVPSPRPPASPAGADYSRLTPVEREYIEYHADAPVPAPVMDAIRAAYPRVTASGPPGAVAAKESRDNAAAPEGAAKCESPLDIDFPDPEPCGCEETDALKERLRRVEALVNLWTLQVADYPKTLEGEYGAAGVLSCIRELREALRP